MPHAIAIERLRKGDKTAVAQALNLVEDARPGQRAAIEALLEAVEPAAAAAHFVGITGPPGVGKSTLTSALIQEWRRRNRSVGIVAVDPSSKRSGGALLGDRARIRYDISDSGIFVRSMAAGEMLGGLARATQAAAQVMAAAFDVVVVETVGVGQSETDIEDIADTIIFVVQPGSGDTLQFMKSGIMEIPDILVVNKADQEKLARRASLDLKGTLTYREKAAGGWEPRVLRTSAIAEQGIAELVDAIADHRQFLEERGLLNVRLEKARRWALATLQRLVGEHGIEARGGRKKLAACVAGHPAVSPRAMLRALLELPLK
jgi:LAO/AO transport system kinase